MVYGLVGFGAGADVAGGESSLIASMSVQDGGIASGSYSSSIMGATGADGITGFVHGCLAARSKASAACS